MPSSFTEHYNLNQWEATDQVKREDFNADNAKINAALAAAGNCHIVSGSYVGTGTYGQNNPNSITFPKQPLLVIISGTLVAVAGADQASFAMTNYAQAQLMNLAWTDNTLSWYNAWQAECQLNASGKRYTYVALIAT